VNRRADTHPATGTSPRSRTAYASSPSEVRHVPLHAETTSAQASGALNTFRQLGLALGVAVFGTVFTSRIADGHGSPAGFADGLNATLLVASATALVAGILVLALVREHGATPGAARAPERADP